ncbi:DUF397 domain-containing protein [Streptomyces olivoreticuli]
MGIQWRKSSFSEQPEGACVELALGDGCTLIRESDEPGVIVRATSAELRAFLIGVKAGVLGSPGVTALG